MGRPKHQSVVAETAFKPDQQAVIDKLQSELARQKGRERLFMGVMLEWQKGLEADVGLRHNVLEMCNSIPCAVCASGEMQEGYVSVCSAAGNPEMYGNSTVCTTQSKEQREEIRRLWGIIDGKNRIIAKLVKDDEEKDRIIAGQGGAKGGRLAFYESPNMSTSTPSLYNEQRKKFRKRRGEDLAGSPGDKAKNPQQDKRIGPPKGHVGISHNRKAEAKVRYGIEGACECGSTGLRPIRPITKMVTDVDQSYRERHVAAIIHRARCGGCGKVRTAKTPFLQGTWYGEKMLGLFTNLFGMNATDGNIARFIMDEHGIKICPNSVLNARAAIAAHLEKTAIPAIESHIKQQPYAQMDETKFKRGDGRNGCVWIATVPGATLVKFTPTREAAVLVEHFECIHGMALDCDGYTGYPIVTCSIQRCWRHGLAKQEALAVKYGGREEELYDEMLAFYIKTKSNTTLAPFTISYLLREGYELFMRFSEPVRIYMVNALPKLFTFLWTPGMPPHNNAAEREIRDAVIPQRNARHKSMNARGRAIFSALVSFVRTCRKRKIASGRALIQLILDQNWDMFGPPIEDGVVPPRILSIRGKSRNVFCSGPGPPKPSGSAIASPDGRLARHP